MKNGCKVPERIVFLKRVGVLITFDAEFTLRMKREGRGSHLNLQMSLQKCRSLSH